MVPNMNNLNMRRVLKQPTLRMADGGSPPPSSFKGMVNSVKSAFTKTPEEQARATALAEYQARAAAARTQTAAAPAPTQTAAPMGSQSVLDGREKAAGLREGGPVGGKGKGDKIPALLEPHEFVVSNAMLDAAPGLREELHDLRGEVLAAKGMTPAEADAKAVKGGTLRAADGVATDWTARSLQGRNMAPVASPMQSMADTLKSVVPQPAAPTYTPPKVDPTTGMYDGARGGNYGQGTQAAGAGAAGSGGVGNTNLAGGAGRIAQGGVSLEPTAGGILRDKLIGSSGEWGKLGEAATKPRSIPGAKLVGSALKMAAAPVSAYQTYQDVQKGDYSSAALHGVDTAAGAALFTPAAPAAGAYLGARAAYEAPQMLRDQLGESGLDAVGGTINNIGLRTGLWGTNDDAYLSMRGGDIPTDAPGQPSLRPPTKTLPTNQRGQNFDDPRTVNADPSRASLGTSRDFSNELNGAKKPLPSDLREGVIHKTVDAQGRTTYSGRNVGMNANDEVQMVDGKGQQLRMLNGRGNNYAYATDGKGNATGPTVFADGNTGTVSSNGGTLRAGGDSNYEALMAAAKRGDVTALREYYGNKGQGFGGQSFDEFKAQKAQQAQAAEEEAMFGGMGKNHRAAAVNQYRQTQTAQDHNKVLREGQANQMTVAMAPAKYAQQQRMLAGQLLQQTGGDLGAATKLAMRYGVDPTHLQAAWTADTSNRTAEQGMGLKAQDQFAKDFQAFNPDGTANQGLTAGRQAAVRKLIPGIDNLSAEARSAHMPEAETIAKIYDRVATNPQMGMDKLITAKSPGYDSMPDWKGGTLKKQSFLAGAVTPGSTPNGWYVTHKGVDTPLGDLSQREIEVIRHATKTGNWRGAPKNEQ